uniref:Fido domain-containing protein n=1 Tax=Photinus pyralis TaxID=7054 RepID=A0A1Y1MH38_PHOPY
MATNICYRFLTATQVKRLYYKYIARLSPTQPTMLESAIDSPMNHKRYGQTDLFQLAGVLAQKVILNHPYQDGNKRTALFAADMFLKVNGYQLQKEPMCENDTELNEGLSNAHVLVATSQWTSEDLGNYYASVARTLDDVSEEISEYSKDAVEH